MPTIRELSFALLKSWDADTAWKNKWVENVPDLNQCCVTALVVQDYFGGTILRSDMSGGGKHYWNDTELYGELDLTFTQFGYLKQDIKKEVKSISRNKLLSYKDTLKRYEILRDRVRKELN